VPVEGPVRVIAGVCNFYSYVTLKDEIRRATVGRRPRFRLEERFPDLKSVLDGPVRPVTIAASVACLFDTDRGTEVALQRRSAAVVSAVGSLGVIPLFGLESNLIGGTRSEYGPLTYNFLKEFVEEFYGLEELVRSSPAKRNSPDWVLNSPTGRLVVDELKSGRLTMHVLGMALDLRDGSLTFAVAARFTSSEFLRQLKLDCKASWESEAASSNETPIQFLPVESRELDELAASGEMDSSSIFVLDRAREVFGFRTAGKHS
jgi:hypothetical protein